MQTSKVGLWVLPVALVTACVIGAVPGAAQQTTEETMQRVLRSVATLLPAASAADWEQAAKSREVREALAELAQAADQLEAHGGPEIQSFLYFSRSLGDDARAIRRRVSEDRFLAASSVTRRLTETCVACHVRLPGKTAEEFPSALLQRVNQTALSPMARARLQTATRQFDAALATYEAEFANAAASPAVLETEVPSYLLVALRVRGDAARAARGLSILGQRADLSAQLEQNIELWRSALEVLTPELAGPPSLERARSVLAQGHALSEFPGDGADVVNAVVASSLVYRHLENAKPQGMELARALYVLGQTEAYTRRSYEVSDSQHYLEQAIRLAPHTPLAARAFSQLEREIVLGYAGSRGTSVPSEVQRDLRSLRELSRAFEEPLENGAPAPTPTPDGATPPPPGRKPKR